MKEYKKYFLHMTPHLLSLVLCEEYSCRDKKVFRFGLLSTNIKKNKKERKNTEKKEKKKNRTH